MNIAAYAWLGLLVVCLIVEGSTVSLVALWFSVGALAAMVTALIGAPLWLQVGVFLAVSAILLSLLRPLVRKHIKPRLTATNVDALVGSQGYVTEAIDNITPSGQVKLGAMPWTARSTTGEPIPKGTLVRVDRVEGVKAFVTPVPVEAAVP